MTDFRITKIGEYRTRDGRKAVVECIRESLNYPALGYIINHDGTKVLWEWSLSGTEYMSSDATPNFIVSEWKEPEGKYKWNIIFSDGTISSNYSTIQEAQDNNYVGIGVFRTHLTINPDGTKKFEIVETVWR